MSRLVSQLKAAEKQIAELRSRAALADIGAIVAGRQDLSGWGKAGWVLLIFILPLFGILVYLIARPSEPADRSTAGGYQEPVRPPGESAPR